MNRLVASVILVTWLVASHWLGAGLPPGEAGAKAALEKSSRHGEWVEVKTGGSAAPIRCWVVYPEVKDKAPVVIVIHEIFGLTDWIRSVADQLAADGFIAVAPDLLSGMGKDGGGSEAFGGRDEVVRAIRGLKPEKVMSDVDAVRAWAIALPASNGRSATIGFCWGGSTSFAYAAHQPQLDAAIVYYGTAPKEQTVLEKIKAPVLGLYGADDARVTSTIKATEEEMSKLGKKFSAYVYEGAGHGFLRQQDGKDGANQKAADKAWPKTLEFLVECTGR